MKPNICVVGLGHVGLPLSLTLVECGFKVVGFDKNEALIKTLTRGIPTLHEEGLKRLLRRYLDNGLTLRSEVPQEAQDAFIISVGTLINDETKKPLLDRLIKATKIVSKQLRKRTLFILRSTVPVGTCRHVILPILKRQVKNPLLAYCPERIAEGIALKEIRELPQIVGGLDKESVEKATNIFREITPIIVHVSTLEAAELIKLLDNSYRDLCFAFANEIALICEKFRLDALEVIRAANMGYKRTNVAAPGFVGGSCMTKDSHILINSVKPLGYDPVLIKGARQINEELPLYIAKRAKEEIENNLEKDIKESKIFISGLAFKGQPETDDIRGSSATSLINFFKKYTNHVYGHDFVANKEKIEELGVIPCTLEEGFRGADCVIIATNHKLYYGLDVAKLISTMNNPAVFVDGWHIYKPERIKKNNKVTYVGLGVG